MFQGIHDKRFLTFFVNNIPQMTRVDKLRSKFVDIGVVVDIFIPNKMEKKGQPFGFVRSISERDQNSLLDDLYKVWIGSYKMEVYVPRFDTKLTVKKVINSEPKVFNANFGVQAEDRSMLRLSRQIPTT